MTEIEVITAANDSGLTLYGMGKDRAKFLHHLEAFAALVEAQEREAIAQMFDNQNIWDEEVAIAIRARGTT
jgi:hypothetical protein|tara:strand:- start:1277 stop:1489 length:213 start_codon:yes stop_codon:yes gene_type:complete